MKKNIGIVTWLGNGNYGTSLQAFALYKFISNQGYDCKYINGFNDKDWGLKSFIRSNIRHSYIWEWKEKRKIKKLKEARKLLKLRSFLNNNIDIVYIDTPWQYKKLLAETDVFCVGSDQIWNAYYHFNPFFFLNFAGDVKRISYASSIGTKDFPTEYKEPIKHLLNHFSHISLRELTGCHAVEELTGRKDIKKVLDPTFLLSAKDWREVAKQAQIEISIPGDYILVYLIGDNKDYAKQVDSLKLKTGMKNIIVIPAAENADFKIDGAIVYHEAAVAEFIYLIAHASWICTDSFHATAISINLGKNFTEFLRFKDTDTVSQNSRIYDVLSTFGLMGQLYNNESETWAQPVDFSKIAEKLSKLREDSVSWLINAIEK